MHIVSLSCIIPYIGKGEERGTFILDQQKIGAFIRNLRIEKGINQKQLAEAINVFKDYKAEIKGSFIEGTSHLKKSRDKGHDSRSRSYKNMKLLLAVAILAAILWYLFM